MKMQTYIKSVLICTLMVSTQGWAQSTTQNLDQKTAELNATKTYLNTLYARQKNTLDSIEKLKPSLQKAKTSCLAECSGNELGDLSEKVANFSQAALLSVAALNVARVPVSFIGATTFGLAMNGRMYAYFSDQLERAKRSFTEPLTTTSGRIMTGLLIVSVATRAVDGYIDLKKQVAREDLDLIEKKMASYELQLHGINSRITSLLYQISLTEKALEQSKKIQELGLNSN
jgi:hypothetical protein